MTVVECVECQLEVDAADTCAYVPDYCTDCCSRLVPQCDHKGLRP